VQHGGTRRSRHVVCFVMWLVEGLFGDSVRCRVGYDVWREFSNGSVSKKKNLSHAFKFLPPIFLSPQTPFHEIQNNRRSGHTLHRPMLVVTCRGWDLGHHGPVHRPTPPPHNKTTLSIHGLCSYGLSVFGSRNQAKDHGLGSSTAESEAESEGSVLRSLFR